MMGGISSREKLTLTEYPMNQIHAYNTTITQKSRTDCLCGASTGGNMKAGHIWLVFALSGMPLPLFWRHWLLSVSDTHLSAQAFPSH